MTSIDSSTPAAATNAGATVAVTSFTPPAGALLLIRWSGNTGSASTPASPTITDNLGAHLTYTLLDWQSHANTPTRSGQAAQWWAVVATSAAMTISVTNHDPSDAAGNALHVTVLTDAGGTPTIGAHGKSGSASAASIAQNFTGTAASSWGFIGVADWTATGTETSGTGCTLINGGSGSIGTALSYGFHRRTTADGTNGGTTTLNVTLPATSTDLSWVYAEVVPPAGAATGNPPRSLVTQPWVTPPAVGSAYVERITNPPLPPGLLPRVVVAQPIPPPPPPGAVVVVRVRSAPYLDPPSYRPQIVAPLMSPLLPGRVGLATPRAEPAVTPDVPPAPVVVGGDRAVMAPGAAGAVLVLPRPAEDAPLPPAQPVYVDAARPPTAPGAVLLTRSTADPDFPPVVEPIIAGARPAPPAAGPAVLLRPVTDPAAAPAAPPVVEPVTARGFAPAAAGAVVLVRQVPAAVAAPDVPPVPAVLVRSGATVTPVAAVSTLTASRADPATDTRTPQLVTAQTLSPARAGAVAVTRPHADPPSTIRPALVATPAGWIRIGSAMLLRAPAGAFTAAAPAYLSGPDTSGYPLAGADGGAYTLGGADLGGVALTGESVPEWTLDSTGDRSEGGMS
jgi:hypothetical protein